MSHASIAAPLLKQQIAFLHKLSIQEAHRGKKKKSLFVIFLQLTNEICPPGCQGFH